LTVATTEHDLVVIGAGPGGYVAAIRAAQLGMNVACVEKESALGGTCLRIGCIPSKALLESSARFWETGHALAEHGIEAGKITFDLAKILKRKDEIVQSLTNGVDALFGKNKVTRYTGRAQLAGNGKIKVGNSTVRAKHILIATGSKPATLQDVKVDRKHIITSTEALSLTKVPKRLIVIGAGYIGLEMGAVWHRLGAKVTVLEFLDRILPGMDMEIAGEALKTFQKQGIEFRLKSKVKAARVNGSKCAVETETGEPIEGDLVLVAIGRTPNTEGLGLDLVGIQPDEKGRIPVNDHFATSAENIYAIGDVIRGPMLAHKASEEAMACVEYIATGHGHVDYNAIPAVVYTHPEIACVGKTEEELKESGIDYRKGAFPFRANGRARTLGDTEGRVKLLADAKTDRVLGVHILGPRAGDLIAEATAAMAFGASSEDIARTCHAHPTLAEAVHEAALAVAGRALHM
jgi:dihydrolipoamide dehydrogenase